jgi:LPS export ABC transporter protein LptC
MRFEQRYLFWGLAAIFFLIAFWRPWQQIKPATDLWTMDLKKMEADLVLKDIRYIRNIGEKTHWILNASTAQLYENKDIMNLERIKIKIFLTEGGHVWVTADSGTYRINDDEMLMNGNVKINSEDGYKLFSKTMHFNQKKRLIWTKDRVIIKRNGMKMQGEELEYDLKKSKLTVKRQTAVLPENGEVTL